MDSDSPFQDQVVFKTKEGILMTELVPSEIAN